MSRFFLFVRFENLFYAYFFAYFQQICRSGLMHFIRGSQNISINLIFYAYYAVFMHVMRQAACTVQGSQGAPLRRKQSGRMLLPDWAPAMGCIFVQARDAPPRLIEQKTAALISLSVRQSDIVRFTQKYSHPDHRACHFRVSSSLRLFSSWSCPRTWKTGGRR